jgi:hypothetical protein
MRRMERPWSTRIAVMAACAVMASAAYAGSRYSQPGVVITPNADGSGYAGGTLGGVRNSANTVERLSCTVTRTEVTGANGLPVQSSTVSCVARDANGVVASCTSAQEKFAAALNGVSNDSLIEFLYNAAGNCTRVTVYESASLERKRS